MASLFGDSTVRIAAMWPFPMPSIPSELIEAFEYEPDDLPPALAALCSRWATDEREFLFDGSGGVAEEAWEELSCEAHNANVFGFIGVAECPVFTGTGEGCANFSWGHYRSKRLFASSAEGLIEQAVAWGDQEFAKATAQVSA